MFLKKFTEESFSFRVEDHAKDTLFKHAMRIKTLKSFQSGIDFRTSSQKK